MMCVVNLCWKVCSHCKSAVRSLRPCAQGIPHFRPQKIDCGGDDTEQRSGEEDEEDEDEDEIHQSPVAHEGTATIHRRERSSTSYRFPNTSISEDTFGGQHYLYCNVSDPCETLQRDSSTMWGLVKSDLRGAVFWTPP